jgi:hypothetical protein
MALPVATDIAQQVVSMNAMLLIRSNVYRAVLDAAATLTVIPVLSGAIKLFARRAQRVPTAFVLPLAKTSAARVNVAVRPNKVIRPAPLTTTLICVLTGAQPLPVNLANPASMVAAKVAACMRVPTTRLRPVMTALRR